MTRRERIQAILRRESVDRPAISFWHHFPDRDETALGLADATVAFQREYDVDLVKLMPTGMYPAIDYGTRVRPSNDQIGTTRFVDGPIKQRGDWKRLKNAPPDRGILAREVEVVKLVRAALGPDTPVIQTIFSPLTIATKVAGTADAVAQAAEQDENELREALALFADDVVAFGRACLRAGADGFFFATQLAGRAALPDGLYRTLGVPYDLRVLSALREGAWCTIMHLHGNAPMFELADEYPIDAVNWHDRETQPRLADAMRMTKRVLVAGISRFGAIATAGSEDVAAEVDDAARQTGGQRLIVAPGCVVPYRVPPENLRAARRAVGGVAA
jgi:uroporphyrinogen decarboxylase